MKDRESALIYLDALDDITQYYLCWCHNPAKHNEFCLSIKKEYLEIWRDFLR